MGLKSLGVEEEHHRCEWYTPHDLSTPASGPFEISFRKAVHNLRFPPPLSTRPHGHQPWVAPSAAASGEVTRRSRKF